MIKDPSTVLTPFCAKLLSKAILSAQISWASNLQDKLAGTTHSQLPSFFFFFFTFHIPSMKPNKHNVTKV